MDTDDLATSLLQRTVCLRGLARSLIADESAADDLAQEAWLAAARCPPRNDRAASPWLRRVIGNLARMRHREEASRRRREHAASRPEKLSTSPDQVLERAELHQRLVQLVLELPEPYRSTVLLRFFEDMTPREIGLHQEVPVTTVRSRLGSALEKLRSRLDRERGGNRELWSLTLLPLAGWATADLARGSTAAAPTASGGMTTAANLLTTGGTIMATKTVVFCGAAGAMLVAAGLAIGTRVGRDEAVLRQLDDLRVRHQRVVARNAELESAATASEGKLRELEALVGRSRGRGVPDLPVVEESAAEPSPPVLTVQDILDDLDKVESLKLTQDELELTLEKHGRAPEFLVAAARLTDDLALARAYLAEALAKEPGSPSALLALLDVQLRAGDPESDVVATLEKLAAADPTNVLPHIHLAQRKAQSGDLQSLLGVAREASLRPRVSDYSSKHFPLLREFYRNAGQSGAVASMLAAFGMRVENLLVLRDYSHAVSDQARTLVAGGDVASALSLVQGVAGLGDKLASSGRTLLEEAVGMALLQRALADEKEIRAAQGDATRVDEIERLEARVKESASRNHRIADGYLPAFRELTPEEVERHLERVFAEGEAAAALDLPGVREAVDGARD